MALKACMNILCGTTSSSQWKTGWSLRSGEFAILCDKCGYAFERNVYCEEFHGNDSGWRECVSCSKRLHCGCIASLPLIELLDCGGVRCNGCSRNLGPSLNTNVGKFDGSGPCIVTDHNVGLKQIPNYNEINRSIHLPTTQNPNSNVAFGLLKQEELLLPPTQAGNTWVSNLAQSSMGIFQKPRLDFSTINMQGKDSYGSMAYPNLNISLGVHSGNLQATTSTINDEREQRKICDTFHKGLISPNLFQAPQKLGFPSTSDNNTSSIPQVRVARPPVEGRGRLQLLPRYWPRITDQELQQITGDSNCTIVPLFEKVLSASDAGRIGRLVLPKACAEAYFPPISQPEGLPIKIQDVKGKEWLFQFRFWPNNNSRMYVLEGVTPCIQSMQLQAGDTVTFSRMDPEGKLVMGFRKASNSASVQSIKGSTESQINAFSRQPDSSSGNARWQNSEACNNERVEEGTLTNSMFTLERKKSKNIGTKSKRLLIDSQDVMALRLTWEEVQGLLRPPQASRPSVVVVEDYEFEEYDEPPVFGKHSVFTARSTGVVEQWVQCDNCSKWRRLPADILLPPKWVCSDNAWDPIRCFCSVPEELSPKELESIQQVNKDSTTKRRTTMANRIPQEQELSGLNALPTTPTLVDNTTDPGTSSVAATTKHPRHRPGCSCIVCIQPPSGKGKHKSTCTCTVCMTVKRRFKTLMMRKKKRQSEQEAEIALKNQQKQNSTPIVKQDDKSDTVVGVGVGPTQDQSGGTSLDLNCQPGREEASLMNLLQLASLPLEAYIKHNGLSSLSSENVGCTSLPRQADVGDIEDHPLGKGNPGNGGGNTENEQ